MKFSLSIFTLALASLAVATPTPTFNWPPANWPPCKACGGTPPPPKPSSVAPPPNPPKPPVSYCKKVNWNLGCCKTVQPCSDNSSKAKLGLLNIIPTGAQLKEKVGFGCSPFGGKGKCESGSKLVCFEVKAFAGISLGAYEADYDEDD